MSETVRLVLTIIQVIVSLVLILTVIFQSGKQSGLSGSINGVADTFFGKNKALLHIKRGRFGDERTVVFKASVKLFHQRGREGVGVTVKPVVAQSSVRLRLIAPVVVAGGREIERRRSDTAFGVAEGIF